jgi:hypothetical protein
MVDHGRARRSPSAMAVPFPKNRFFIYPINKLLTFFRQGLTELDAFAHGHAATSFIGHIASLHWSLLLSIQFLRQFAKD